MKLSDTSGWLGVIYFLKSSNFPEGSTSEKMGNNIRTKEKKRKKTLSRVVSTIRILWNQFQHPPLSETHTRNLYGVQKSYLMHLAKTDFRLSEKKSLPSHFLISFVQ